MKHCSHSYWPWRDEFLRFFLWRWWGDKGHLLKPTWGFESTIQQCIALQLNLEFPTFTRCSESTSITPILSAHICPRFSSLFIFSTPPHPQKCKSGEIERVHDVCTLCQHMHLRQQMKTGRWGEAKGWARAVDVPVSNTFPQVEVCSPGGCVSAGKLCNEQKAGSLPDRIPTQPHIYLAFQKCSAYQWVLLTCQSRQRSASSAL